LLVAADQETRTKQPFADADVAPANVGDSAHDPYAAASSQFENAVSHVFPLFAAVILYE
jgi:hypothetical protein